MSPDSSHVADPSLQCDEVGMAAAFRAAGKACDIIFKCLKHGLGKHSSH